MKIGVITFSDSSDNYGQLLQCYALQVYLRELGHTPYLIRYMTSKSPILERIRINLTFEKVVSLLSPAARRAKRELRALKQQNQVQNKARQFDAFRNQFLAMSDCTYYSIDELRENPPQADMYICGSDQVWGGLYELSNTAAWFLDFGCDKTKRISYAASIGSKPLTASDKRKLKRYLKRFDSISVRESTAQEVCINLGYTTTKLVLDPSLLVSPDMYRCLFDGATTAENAPYLFIYVLNVASKEELYWDAIQQYISDNELDVKVVYSSGNVPARELLLPTTTGLLATMPEWLSYICHANAVVTTSFHGVVLCIIMNRPFLALLLTNKYAAGNVRIIDLLEKLGLSERIYDTTLSFDAQMSRPICWEGVREKMIKLRLESQEFLNDALSGDL